VPSRRPRKRANVWEWQKGDTVLTPKGLGTVTKPHGEHLHVRVKGKKRKFPTAEVIAYELNPVNALVNEIAKFRPTMPHHEVVRTASAVRDSIGGLSDEVARDVLQSSYGFSHDEARALAWLAQSSANSSTPAAEASP